MNFEKEVMKKLVAAAEIMKGKGYPKVTIKLTFGVCGSEIDETCMMFMQAGSDAQHWVSGAETCDAAADQAVGYAAGTEPYSVVKSRREAALAKLTDQDKRLLGLWPFCRD